MKTIDASKTTTIQRETLSDGSYVYNVILTGGAGSVRVACTDERTAAYLFAWLQNSANVTSIS